MKTFIKCLSCSHVAEVENDTELDDAGFMATSIFKCSECAARMVYGELAPRVVVEPIVDGMGRPFIRLRFQDPLTKADIHVAQIDPQYAAVYANDVLTAVLR